jgi:gluconolactonase
MISRVLLASLVSLMLLTASAATPAIAQILPAGATPTKLTPASVGGIAIAFTEGALWDGTGGVYFSDLHDARFPTTDPSRILHYEIASGATTVADAHSGGTNGMYIAGGYIYTADRDGSAKPGQVRQISRRLFSDVSAIDAALATNYMGTIFNGPNDLVVDSKGGVYFSDPDYNGRLQTKAAYYINPAGSLSRFLTANNPNGIVLSPDGKTLYVAIEGDGKIIAYDVSQDDATFGSLSNQRTFATMNNGNTPDGITIDPAGDIYAAGNKSVWAWNPAGTKLFQLSTPGTGSAQEDPTNLDFGGTDGKSLFITAGKSLYSVHLNIATPITGDYNGNGVVDAADYTVWQDTVGSTTNFAADGNGDHVIDQADYDYWLNKFPASAGSAAIGAGATAAVPEPSTLTAAILAAFFLGNARSRLKQN